jgi:hypothetical protein
VGPHFPSGGGLTGPLMAQSKKPATNNERIKIIMKFREESFLVIIVFITLVGLPI